SRSFWGLRSPPRASWLPLLLLFVVSGLLCLFPSLSSQSCTEFVCGCRRGCSVSSSLDRRLSSAQALRSTMLCLFPHFSSSMVRDFSDVRREFSHTPSSPYSPLSRLPP